MFFNMITLEPFQILSFWIMSLSSQCQSWVICGPVHIPRGHV